MLDERKKRERGGEKELGGRDVGENVSARACLDIWECVGNTGQITA